MIRSYFFFILVLLNYLENCFIFTQCIVNIHNLNHQHPLILRTDDWQPYGNNPHYLPQASGDIMFDANEEVLLHCPGSNIIVGPNNRGQSSLRTSCQFMNVFQILATREEVKFTEIKCAEKPMHSVRQTGKICNGKFNEIEIGFHFEKLFLIIMKVCFDPELRNTLYVQHNISNHIRGAQYGKARPFFSEDDFYDLPKEVDHLYKVPQQRATIERILMVSEGESCIGGKSSSKVLTRGHLAAKGDFVYSAQQLATFHFINVAPQWKDINNLNWNELEKSVREYASNFGNELMIYTGTLGIMSFKNKDLFLYVDNVVEAIPVPEYYWKVVYDAKTKKGIAFVTLNDPYDYKEPFCRDICDSLDWHLSWEKDKQCWGLSFCCSVNELRRHVQFPDFVCNGLLR